MEPTTAAIKLGGAAAALSVSAPLYFGVSGPTVLAAFAGAMASLAYAKQDEWAAILKPTGSTTKERWIASLKATAGVAFALVASAFVASWTTIVIPHLPMLAFMQEIPRAPMAGILAFGNQWLIPVAVKAMQDRIKGWGAK